MSVEALVEISRHYGKNPDYVLAGGGNTSWKDEENLYIKASGYSLAEAAADSFIKMDRKALSKIWVKKYPESSSERESAVLADMMAARKPDEEISAGPVNKRPSVEVLLHDILPFAFVVHLHPALVNGLTCSRRGEEAMREVFGVETVWIPIANPGYVLSKAVKSAVDEFFAVHRKPAAVIFLQNHGVFVGDNSIDGIKEIYGEITHKIGAWIKRRPDFQDEKNKTINSRSEEILKTLAELAGAAVFTTGKEISSLVKDRASFAPVARPFTPDHIVYAGSDPLFVEAGSGIRETWKDHVEKTGRAPKITAVEGTGVFAAAATEKAANIALDLFKDAVKIAVYSESFGGPEFMTQDKIDFINNWEAERFRASVSTK